MRWIFPIHGSHPAVDGSDSGSAESILRVRFTEVIRRI